MPRPRLSLVILFVLIAVGGGSLLGWFFRPDAWFDGLAKPWFNPPGWLFAPVWTILYVLIGIAGARVWTMSREGYLRILWIVQMILNFMWTPVFFGAHRPGWALVIIILLWIVIVGFARRAWRHEPTSGVLFLPYIAWVSFATCLNAAIWRLNM